MSNNSHLPPTLPPVFLEPPRPRAKRRKGLMAMSDAEVWDFSNREILASSVDAECAFSGGRLMINHLQHQMSSRTFQAQMTVGSWFGTPLLPNLSRVASIVEKNM